MSYDGSSFDAALDAVEHLPAEQQAQLVKVVKQRLAAAGRKRLLEEVAQGKAEHGQGKSAATTLDQLMDEIES